MSELVDVCVLTRMVPPLACPNSDSFWESEVSRVEVFGDPAGWRRSVGWTLHRVGILGHSEEHDSRPMRADRLWFHRVVDLADVPKAPVGVFNLPESVLFGLRIAPEVNHGTTTILPGEVDEAGMVPRCRSDLGADS